MIHMFFLTVAARASVGEGPSVRIALFVAGKRIASRPTNPLILFPAYYAQYICVFRTMNVCASVGTINQC